MSLENQVESQSSNSISLPCGVFAVRYGSGANCSSIGSVIDLLFGSMVFAGSVYAAIAAALEQEEQKIDSKNNVEKFL